MNSQAFGVILRGHTLQSWDSGVRDKRPLDTYVGMYAILDMYQVTKHYRASVRGFIVSRRADDRHLFHELSLPFRDTIESLAAARGASRSHLWYDVAM